MFNFTMLQKFRFFSQISSIKLSFALVTLIILILPYNLWGKELIFSTNFENSVDISNWYECWVECYKSISSFKNLPGSGYPGNLLTMCGKSDIENYHKVRIESVNRNGANTKALYFLTIKYNYPN